MIYGCNLGSWRGHHYKSPTMSLACFSHWWLSLAVHLMYLYWTSLLLINCWPDQRNKEMFRKKTFNCAEIWRLKITALTYTWISLFDLYSPFLNHSNIIILQTAQLLILLGHLIFQGSIFSEHFAPSSLSFLWLLGFSLKSLSLLFESLFENFGPLKSYSFLWSCIFQLSMI